MMAFTLIFLAKQTDDRADARSKKEHPQSGCPERLLLLVPQN
jgi:hypothetical protein